MDDMGDHGKQKYPDFINAQLPLFKVAALCFYKLALLDPVGASWAIIPEAGWEGNVTTQPAQGL